MVKVANLSADLTANTSSFDKSLSTASRSMVVSGRKMSKSASNFNQNISSSFKRAAASAAAFQGPLGGVAGRLSGLASIATQTGVALGGALLVLSGAAFTIGKAAKVADDFEGSMLRVNAILRATRGASGQTAEGIREISEELAAASLASVQGVEAAAAKLLTFRRISGDTFKRTLVLAQDLAAAGFGSLSDNVTQLGKALEDPIKNLGALTRNGVSFSKAQKDVIKSLFETGRAAEAQSKILDAIATQVGGAGGAEGGPIAKGLDLLSQRLEDFFLKLDKATGAGTAFSFFLVGLSSRLKEITGVLAPTEATLVDQLATEMERLNQIVKEAPQRIAFFEALPESAGKAEELTFRAIESQKKIVEGLKARVKGEEDAAKAILTRAAAEQEAIATEFEASRVAEARAKADKIFFKEQDRREAKIRSTVDALQIEINALRAESEAFDDNKTSIEEAALAREILTQQQKLGAGAETALGETLEFQIRQRAKLAAVIKTEQDLRKRSAQIIEENKGEVGRLNDEIKEFNELRKEGLLTEEQYQTALTRTNEKIMDLSEANKNLERVLDSVGSSIESTFEDFVLGAASAGDAVRALGLDLAKLALRETTKGLFGDLFKSAGKSLLGGFFADGGRPPLNKVSVVGEGGPELFVPDTAGTIIPNGEMGGGGGNTFFVDNRGASVEAVQRLEQFVTQVNGSIEPRAVDAVVQESQRNPVLFGGK